MSSDTKGEPESDLDRDDVRRARQVAYGIAAVFIVGMAWLVITNQVAIIWKTMVVPLLFVGAAVLGRAREFIRDWPVFLAATLLFDASRGFVFGLVNYFEIPIRMVYAIDIDIFLFGEPLSVVAVQQLLGPDGQAGWLERLLALVYASHFVVFLVFGLIIWLFRPAAFAHFRASMLLVMAGGVLGYFLVPTVPPWMADETFHVIPPLENYVREVLHQSLPRVTAAFDTNPIAAMPSIHCAFPTLLTFVAIRHFGKRGLFMAAYTLVVYLSTVHLAQHYVADILAGALLALVGYWATHHNQALRRWMRVDEPAGTEPAHNRQRALMTTLLLVMTVAASYVGRATAPRETLMTPEFIARELDGRSVMADYFRGMAAFRAGHFEEAQPFFDSAARTVPKGYERNSALAHLARSAFANRDYPTTIRAAKAVEKLTPDLGLAAGEALLRTGQLDFGFQLLEQSVRAYPEGSPPWLHYDRLRAEFATAGEPQASSSGQEEIVPIPGPAPGKEPF